MSSIYKGQRDKSSIDLGGLDTSYKPGRKGSIVKVQPEGGLGLIGVGMSLATIAGRGKYLWGVIGNQVTKITTRKQLSKIRSEGGNILQSTRKPAIKSIENKGTLLQKVEPTLDAIARGFNKMKVQRDRKLLDRLERLPPYTFKGKKYKPGQIEPIPNKLPIPQALRNLATQSGREIARRVTGRNPVRSTGGGGRGATSPFARPTSGRIMNVPKAIIPGLTIAGDINRNQPRAAPPEDDFPLGPPGIGGPPFRESPMDITFDPREIPQPTMEPIAEDFLGQKLFGLRRSRQEIDRDELATRLLEGSNITFKGKKYKPGQIDAFMDAANQTILDTPLTKRTKKIKSRRDTKGRQVTTLGEDVARVLKPKKKMTGGKVYASTMRKPKKIK